VKTILCRSALITCHMLFKLPFLDFLKPTMICMPMICMRFTIKLWGAAINIFYSSQVFFLLIVSPFHINRSVVTYFILPCRFFLYFFPFSFHHTFCYTLSHLPTSKMANVFNTFINLPLNFLRG
jgi:hypothetical protein